jgi:hypothetical protein
VHIAALSETRLAEQGELRENGAGYTFFWSGRSEGERREAGVGFAIQNSLLSKLPSAPKGVHDRLMTLRIPLAKKKHATLISAYAPTMNNTDEAKERFYEDLHLAIAAVPKSDKLVILGDFNARVGRDFTTWNGTIGRHGVGNCNSNGLLLLEACVTHDLLLTNTFFRLPHRKRTSWMHPRSKHWHLIDYIITRRCDLRDVRVTKSMCGADCWTDHRLILSKFLFRIPPQRRPQGKKPPKRLNVAKLKDPTYRETLQVHLNTALEGAPLSGDVDTKWTSFRDTVYSAAHSALGPMTRKHADWFDESDSAITALIEEMHQKHKALNSDPRSSSKRTAYLSCKAKVQRDLREMQEKWLSAKADEIQAYADKHDMKNFYSAIKELYGPPSSSGSSPVLNADGTRLLTEKEDILSRWAEHFESVLNRPSTINEEAISQLPQVPVDPSLDVPPSEPETEKAIKALSSGKAPGPDAIPAEVYKNGGRLLTQTLTQLFQSIWTEKKIPQEMKDASIVHLYKKKGNRQQCDNHRGISLLSIAGKILARIILNRLITHLEQKSLLPESQCGFRKDRGTVDMIFAARQLQEKCREQNVGLFMTFVDLTKAFDCVCREGLWLIMAKFGCPDTLIKIVREFHDGMSARVQDCNGVSEPFQVSNGVKQGCVLAPTLFSMMFAAMLNTAFSQGSFGVDLRYRMDGKLFNLRRLQAKTKVKKECARDLLFADDCALCAGSQEDMQKSVDLFAAACADFGLTISLKKTEVLHQPAPGNPYEDGHVTINGQLLQPCEKFTYLGSTLSKCATLDEEIPTRISRACAAFGRLRSTVWERRGITLKTKLKVYKAAVLPSLLYAAESWTVYSRHSKALNATHMRLLRKILHIRWQDRIPDTEVLQKAQMESIHTMLLRRQLRWTGHVVRMPDHRLPKRIFYSELAIGARSHGGQRKRFKDTLKVRLRQCDINIDTWETECLDRDSWRGKIHQGAANHESNRISVAQRKRSERKARLETGAADIPCPHCTRFFRARIGLFSHMKAHH